MTATSPAAPAFARSALRNSSDVLAGSLASSFSASAKAASILSCFFSRSMRFASALAFAMVVFLRRSAALSSRFLRISAKAATLSFARCSSLWRSSSTSALRRVAFAFALSMMSLLTSSSPIVAHTIYGSQHLLHCCHLDDEIGNNQAKDDDGLGNDGQDKAFSEKLFLLRHGSNRR